MIAMGQKSSSVVLVAGSSLALALPVAALTYPAPNGTGRGGPLPFFNPSIVAANLFGPSSPYYTDFDVAAFDYQSATIGGVDVRSVAVFSNANGTYDLPTKGLTFSTGHYADYADGASTSGSLSTNYSPTNLFRGNGSSAPPPLDGLPATTAQTALLQPIQPDVQEFFDVTQFDITLAPDFGPNKLVVDFAFGSEEFPDQPPVGFNDIFAFFVEDASQNKTNYALINGAPIDAGHPLFAAEGVLTELDGLIKDPNPGASEPFRFRLGAPLAGVGDFTPINILLADVNDGIYDTTLHIGGLRVVKNGDVDLDTNFDADDIDLLFDAVNASSFDQLFDLDYDSFIDTDDVDVLVNSLLGTDYGDANLDDTVDALDQAILTANLNTAGGWADGDFNGDGFVDSADQVILTANLSGGGSGVPEPAGAAWLAAAWLAVSRRRRA